MRSRRSCPRRSRRCPAGSCSEAPRRTRRAGGRGSQAGRCPAGSDTGRTGSTRRRSPDAGPGRGGCRAGEPRLRRRAPGRNSGSGRSSLSECRGPRMGAILPVGADGSRAQAAAPGTLRACRRGGVVSRAIRIAAAGSRAPVVLFVLLVLLLLLAVGLVAVRLPGRRRRLPPTRRRSRGSRSHRPVSTWPPSRSTMPTDGRWPSRSGAARSRRSASCPRASGCGFGATVRRSSWIGWLVGGTEHVTPTLTTPETKVRATLLHLAPNAPVVPALRRCRKHRPPRAARLQAGAPGLRQAPACACDRRACDRAEPLRRAVVATRRGRGRRSRPRFG